MGNLVDAVKTPARPQAVADCLVAAWHDDFSSVPTLQQICVLLSQWALETAEGTKCIGWNIGNAKRPDPAMGDYCEYETEEYVNGAPVKMVCRFAVYPSMAQGVAAYLHAMCFRWTRAWPSVLAGNPDGFAEGLKAQGYYTAPVEAYAAGLKRYFDKYQITIVIDGEPTVPERL